MISQQVHPHFESNSVGVAARALKDPENRSIEIGVICTLLFHVLLLALAPRLPVELLHGTPIAFAGTGADGGSEFDIELAPDLAAPAPRADPHRFIETNPEAPENEPDESMNFSNRNQQLAQPEPATEPSPDRMPSVQGQDAIRNDTAIVSGTSSEPQAGAPVTSVTAAIESITAQQAQQARAEQVPLSGTERLEGDSTDGVGANISESKSPSNNAEQPAEGVRGAESPTGGLVVVPEAGARSPAPRPRLSQARPTILQNRSLGTDRVGVLAAPAFRSEFGDYLAELIAIVDAQWRNILGDRSVYPPATSHVSVTFNLTSAGEIKIVAVEETSGRPGVYAALSAIQDRQPYRKWSQKMITVLGNEQQLVFVFYY